MTTTGLSSATGGSTRMGTPRPAGPVDGEAGDEGGAVARSVGAPWSRAGLCPAGGAVSLAARLSTLDNWEEEGAAEAASDKDLDILSRLLSACGADRAGACPAGPAEGAEGGSTLGAAPATSAPPAAPALMPADPVATTLATSTPALTVSLTLCVVFWPVSAVSARPLAPGRTCSSFRMMTHGQTDAPSIPTTAVKNVIGLSWPLLVISLPAAAIRMAHTGW